MKIILKNLVTALKRFGVSVTLNLLGLSVAFTAFIEILLQVRFEQRYGLYHPKADGIYRVEVSQNTYSQCIFDQPEMEAMAAVSSHIEAWSLLQIGDWLRNTISVPRSDGSQDIFKVEYSYCQPDLLKIVGFDFVEGDTTALNDPTRVMLPLSLARTIFGDQSAVGQRLTDQATVGAVYRDFPKNSIFPNTVYLPQNWRNVRGNRNYMLLLALDDPSHREEVERLMREKYISFNGYTAQTPEEEEELAAFRLTLRPIPEVYFNGGIGYDGFITHGSRTTTNVLLWVSVLVIVIASINFVNFASAMTPMRMKMINLQKIMGGGNGLLRLALVCEAAVIAVTAWVVALGIVSLLARTGVADLIDADMGWSANLPLLGLSGLIALGVGIAAGLYPAFYMTSFPPIMAVKGSFGMSPTGRRYRNVLVCFQFVVSLALIIVTLFVNLQNRYTSLLETGFETEQVVRLELTPQVAEHGEQFEQELMAHAGIERVAFARQDFGAEQNYMGWGRRFRGEQISYKVLVVSPAFLDVMGIGVAEGRNFLESDPVRAMGTYIFNQEAKAKFEFALNDVISNEQDGMGWGEIVGFTAPGLKVWDNRTAENPFCFFVPGTVNWGGRDALNFAFVRLKAGANPAAAIDHIRKTATALSPVEFDIRFVDSTIDARYQKESRMAQLITLFSVLAIVISLVGVFGLVLFETQYRRKEIGIRRVNGATVQEILAMFNRKFLLIVAIGFCVAAPLSWYATNEWLTGFLRRVPLHWWVFAAALLIVGVITVVTVTVRSWHAATENPVRSIKTE